MAVAAPPDFQTTDPPPFPDGLESGGLELVGNYELGRTIGIGAWAKVKYAVNTLTGQPVAVKILDKTKIKESQMEEQIKKEIMIMKMIDHPSIVKLYEVLSSERKIFMVMELVTGGELLSKLVKEGSFDEATARDYFRQLISGIAFCHAHGIVHRDIKAENLLLDEAGTLKITDFGLSAMNVGGNQALQTSCGTPNYVAPEVLMDRGYDGEAADIWSAGVILYLLVAGFLPFSSDEPLVEMFRKIMKADYEVPDHFSEPLVDLLQKILHPDPKLRIRVPEIRKHPWYAEQTADFDDPELNIFEADVGGEGEESVLRQSEIENALSVTPANISDASQHPIPASPENPGNIPPPPTINAFDLINMLGRLALQRMFLVNDIPSADPANTVSSAQTLLSSSSSSQPQNSSNQKKKKRLFGGIPKMKLKKKQKKGYSGKDSVRTPASSASREDSPNPQHLSTPVDRKLSRAMSLPTKQTKQKKKKISRKLFRSKRKPEATAAEEFTDEGEDRGEDAEAEEEEELEEVEGEEEEEAFTQFCSELPAEEILNRLCQILGRMQSGMVRFQLLRRAWQVSISLENPHPSSRDDAEDEEEEGAGGGSREVNPSLSGVPSAVPIDYTSPSNSPPPQSAQSTQSAAAAVRDAQQETQKDDDSSSSSSSSQPQRSFPSSAAPLPPPKKVSQFIPGEAGGWAGAGEEFVVLSARLYRMTPQLHLVECTRVKGKHALFLRFYRYLRESFQSFPQQPKTGLHLPGIGRVAR